MPPATATAGVIQKTPLCIRPRPLARVSLCDMEDLLYGGSEEPGQCDGQGERRGVAAGLDGVDGLPGNPERGGQVALRQVLRHAQLAHGVAGDHQLHWLTLRSSVHPLPAHACKACLTPPVSRWSVLVSSMLYIIGYRTAAPVGVPAICRGLG